MFLSDTEAESGPESDTEAESGSETGDSEFELDEVCNLYFVHNVFSTSVCITISLY